MQSCSVDRETEASHSKGTLLSTTIQKWKSVDLNAVLWAANLRLFFCTVLLPKLIAKIHPEQQPSRVVFLFLFYFLCVFFFLSWLPTPTENYKRPVIREGSISFLCPKRINTNTESSGAESHLPLCPCWRQTDNPYLQVWLNINSAPKGAVLYKQDKVLALRFGAQN